MILSALIQDEYIKFFVKIPLTNEHVLYNYFVRVSARNSRRNSVLMFYKKKAGQDPQ